MKGGWKKGEKIFVPRMWEDFKRVLDVMLYSDKQVIENHLKLT